MSAATRKGKIVFPNNRLSPGDEVDWRETLIDVAHRADNDPGEVSTVASPPERWLPTDAEYLDSLDAT